eukprot:TRINITY_DN4195_c3_g2_i2.p1 TRINITY_DN4195_c3_g2~~TRINITY_DN4195_c3_g2_i2.p1  ORF type:complete len:234 (-),score=59.11 TRINITY_DN4195_c3_g2_i2:2-703(-)
MMNRFSEIWDKEAISSTKSQEEFSKVLHLIMEPKPANYSMNEKFEYVKKMTNQLMSEGLKQDEKELMCPIILMELDELQSNAESMSKQIKQEEKEKTSFIQVYSSKLTIFKRVLSQLFGYKIELKGNGEVFLVYPIDHIHTKDINKDKYFQIVYDEKSDQLSLSDTPYAAEVKSLVDTYLKKHNNFAFLMASVIMSQFNKSTTTTSSSTTITTTTPITMPKATTFKIIPDTPF